MLNPSLSDHATMPKFQRFPDFKRAPFGARSEKPDPEHYELALEDIETAMAAFHAEDAALDAPQRASQSLATSIADLCPSTCCVTKK